MWCVCPPSPLLWQAPRLPWCILCAFHIGSTALLLGVPYMSSLLPPVRLVMFLCLPYTGPIWGGPARSRRRVRCIYCPRDPWLYLFRPCHIGPPGSGSQWICFVWGLVKGTVKRLSPPPLVSASECWGLLSHSLYQAPAFLPICMPTFSYRLTSPLPVLPDHIASTAASTTASAGVGHHAMAIDRNDPFYIITK